jgi:hypothetical protein
MSSPPARGLGVGRAHCAPLIVNKRRSTWCEEIGTLGGDSVPKDRKLDHGILVPLSAFRGANEMGALERAKHLVAVRALRKTWKKLVEFHFALPGNAIANLHEEILFLSGEIANVGEKVRKHFRNRVAFCLESEARTGKLDLEKDGANDEENDSADKDDRDAEVDKGVQDNLPC